MLVTGVGGNVGQGIIRNLRSIDVNFRIVGTNTESFSAGNHLCDQFYQVPYAVDESYIDVINGIIKKEKIVAIFPATDYEVFYLAKGRDLLNSFVICSDVETSGIYLDKYSSYLHHLANGIPFATSFLPSEYKGQFSECIAKPREGRGSRGLHFNPSDPYGFLDKEYVIQELHRGIEVTTAFYVDRKGKLHGFITLERELGNGATVKCHVNTDYDQKISEILEQIITVTSIRGSANLQCIVTPEGEVFPFEVNCRISGTNSIRSQFGFEDVRYAVQEYVYNQEPDTPRITKGSAIRILMDVIYPGEISSDKLRNREAKHHLF